MIRNSSQSRELLRFGLVCLCVAIVAATVSWTVAGLRSWHAHTNATTPDQSRFSAITDAAKLSRHLQPTPRSTRDSFSVAPQTGIRLVNFEGELQTAQQGPTHPVARRLPLESASPSGVAVQSFTATRASRNNQGRIAPTAYESAPATTSAYTSTNAAEPFANPLIHLPGQISRQFTQPTIGSSRDPSTQVAPIATQIPSTASQPQVPLEYGNIVPQQSQEFARVAAAESLPLPTPMPASSPPANLASPPPQRNFRPATGSTPSINPQDAPAFLGDLPAASFPSGEAENSTSSESPFAPRLNGPNTLNRPANRTSPRNNVQQPPTPRDVGAVQERSNIKADAAPDSDGSAARDSANESMGSLREFLQSPNDDAYDAQNGIGTLPPNASLNVSVEGNDDDSAKSSRDLLLQSARNAVRLGDFEKASKRLTEYLRRYPDDGDARIEFAFVLQKLGRYESATSQLQHLMREFPSNYKFKRSYADLQLETQNYPLAEPALRELLVHPDYRTDAAIDLARLFAWTQRPLEADEIYEAYLAEDYPKDRNGQLELAELLVEINRPGRAMDLLLKLHEANPVDLRVLKLMITVSARSDNPTATFDFINKLRIVQPENVTARNELAKQLLAEGFNKEAVLVDQQILDFDPQFLDALIRSAQASLRMFEPQSAFATLQTIANPDHPEVMIAKGEYHALIGEFADAIAVHQRALARDADYVKARMGLGHSYVRAGQFLRGAAEFSKIQLGDTPQSNQVYLSAQLARGRALAHARRYDEAIAVIDQAMATNTGSYTDQILDAYIDVMNLARRYSQVVIAIQTRLPDVELQPHRERQLQAKLGLAMARARDFSGALQEFESLEFDDSDPIPEAVYGKYLTLRALGSPQRADQSLNRHFGLLASDTYLRVRIAELATEDCDCCLARRVLEPLNRCCDQNPLIANRIGEACMMCSACEQASCCLPYFQGVLNQSPTNVQAMLGMARIHTRQGSYGAAETYFERANASMSDDINLVREIARLQSQWHGPNAAMAGYNRALSLTGGEHLYDAAQVNPERVGEFEQEFARLGELSSVVSTEMAAEQLSGWKPLSHIDSLEGLFTLEPTNESSLFQIGQAYSHLNRTRDAICAYKRLLCVNPCSQEARTAIARNELEMQPQLHIISGALHQRGRDDLVAMDAGFGGLLFQFPFGDEDEFLQLGYTRARYDPPFGRPLDGDKVTVRMQHKPYWWLKWWAQLDYEKYDFGFDDRINFNLGWEHRYIENASYRVRVAQQNVIENFESIDQDIHRIGAEVGHYWQPTRRFVADAFYRYWDYSDDNYAHNAGLYTGYTLQFGRHQWRWLTNVDWSDYQRQTVLPNAPFVNGAIYPYFSPDQFFFVTGGLEYKRFFSCNTFKGANRHWVVVFMGARMDNDTETYFVGRGRLGHDIYNWLTLTGFANVIQSPVYDLVEGGLQLTARF